MGTTAFYGLSHARGVVYGAGLAPAIHGSERRMHFDGGSELFGIAMH